MPTEPFLVLSSHKWLGQLLEHVGLWENDSHANEVSHSEYAHNIALLANTAPHLQLQLDKFHTYTIAKRLALNTHETKVMAFFCSNPPILAHYGTTLNIAQQSR